MFIARERLHCDCYLRAFITLPQQVRMHQAYPCDAPSSTPLEGGSLHHRAPPTPYDPHPHTDAPSLAVRAYHISPPGRRAMGGKPAGASARAGARATLDTAARPARPVGVMHAPHASLPLLAAIPSPQLRHPRHAHRTGPTKRAGAGARRHAAAASKPPGASESAAARTLGPARLARTRAQAVLACSA